MVLQRDFRYGTDFIFLVHSAPEAPLPKLDLIDLAVHLIQHHLTRKTEDHKIQSLGTVMRGSMGLWMRLIPSNWAVVPYIISKPLTTTILPALVLPILFQSFNEPRIVRFCRNKRILAGKNNVPLMTDYSNETFYCS